MAQRYIWISLILFFVFATLFIAIAFGWFSKKSGQEALRKYKMANIIRLLLLASFILATVVTFIIRLIEAFGP